MTDDATLLREYVNAGSERAFAELVARHLDLVYSAALRYVAGDLHRALDVTQAVFCEMARKAPRLLHHHALSGWLYTTARFIGARVQRTESRRRDRELSHEASMDSQQHHTPEETWAEVRPVLDEAMGALGEKDRRAIILRFFQDKPLAEVGDCLGLTENAARMRVDRALEKLRRLLARRGIHSTASALCTSLAAYAVAPAPSGMAAALVGPALASGTSAGATASFVTWSLLHVMNTAKISAAIAAIGFMAAIATFVGMNQANVKLRAELVALRNQAPPAAAPGRAAPATSSDTAELARLRAEHRELLRLKGDIALLRQDQAELARLRSKLAEPDQAKTPETTQEKVKKAAEDLALTKMNFTVPWAQAFQAFARDNGGKMPEAFGQVTNYIAPDLQAIAFSFPTDDFEILFRGSLAEIREPARAIILREKQPFVVQPSGEAWRTYLFADGHSEIHLARDGNFEPWEQQHMASSP